MEQNGALISLSVLLREKPSSMYDFTLSQHQRAVAELRRNGLSFLESY
jgi:hypothetical protein